MNLELFGREIIFQVFQPMWLITVPERHRQTDGRLIVRAINFQAFQPAGLRKTFFPARPRFYRSRSSKVIDFGTNRKRVCDFLLVRHSNFGSSSQRFGDIACFLLRNWPHSQSTLIWGVFPLDQIARVKVSPSMNLKLFGREIIFQVFQPMWLRYLNVTDRRTDGRTTYCGITALSI